MGNFVRSHFGLTEGVIITTMNFQYGIAQYLPLVATLQKLMNGEYYRLRCISQNWDL